MQRLRDRGPPPRRCAADARAAAHRAAQRAPGTRGHTSMRQGGNIVNGLWRHGHTYVRSMAPMSKSYIQGWGSCAGKLVRHLTVVARALRRRPSAHDESGSRAHSACTVVLKFVRSYPSAE